MEFEVCNPTDEFILVAPPLCAECNQEIVWGRFKLVKGRGFVHFSEYFCFYEVLAKLLRKWAEKGQILKPMSEIEKRHWLNKEIK